MWGAARRPGMQISETQPDDAALALHPVMSRAFHPSRHDHALVVRSTCNPTIIELRVRSDIF